MFSLYSILFIYVYAFKSPKARDVLVFFKYVIHDFLSFLFLTLLTTADKYCKVVQGILFQLGFYK